MAQGDTLEALWSWQLGTTPPSVRAPSPTCQSKEDQLARCPPQHVQMLFVHFKVHDFSEGALYIAPGRVVFSKSGFGTGLFKHRNHGKFSVDETRANQSAFDVVFGYWKQAQREPQRITTILRDFCAGGGTFTKATVAKALYPSCSLPWESSARFVRPVHALGTLLDDRTLVS